MGLQPTSPNHEKLVFTAIPELVRVLLAHTHVLMKASQKGDAFGLEEPAKLQGLSTLSIHRWRWLKVSLFVCVSVCVFTRVHTSSGEISPILDFP